MPQNTSHAVFARRNSLIDKEDFFPTPAWGTRALCENLRVRGWETKSVWEPACGQGHMSRALAEYFPVVRSSDLNDYGFGEVRDFLSGPIPEAEVSDPADWIITNPPFSRAAAFVLRAIRHARQGVAMLVRTSFVEGAGRHAVLFEPHPPTIVLQFVERVPMFKGRVDAKGSTATAYAWIVWHKGERRFDGTEFGWIAPCRHRLQRPEDYD